MRLSLANTLVYPSGIGVLNTFLGAKGRQGVTTLLNANCAFNESSKLAISLSNVASVCHSVDGGPQCLWSLQLAEAVLEDSVTVLCCMFLNVASEG